MKPPFDIRSYAGSAMLHKIAEARYEKLMTLTAFARRNYLQKKGWVETGREVIGFEGKQTLRITWQHPTFGRAPQSRAIRWQVWNDMEQEGLVMRAAAQGS